MFLAGVAALGLIFLWLGFLTYRIYKEKSYLEELFPQGEARQIRGKLREVLENLKEIREENTLIAAMLDDLNKSGLKHIQRVQVQRYNPYNDTGGDQSFSIAMLDGNLDGMIVTSLHSRSGTRIYTKIIKAGLSDLDLSNEEKEVVKKAIK